MLPVKTVRLQLGTLLAADATTLAPAANANKIALIAAPFVPGETLTYASLTFATFTGSAPIVGATGAQDVGTDPVTGDQVVTIKPPAGGYIFSCSAAPASPETIYGYALIDNAGAVLLGTALLPTPVTISAIGDFVDVGNPEIRFVNQPMS